MKTTGILALAIAVVLLTGSLWLGTAEAGDWVDTRVTFTFADDNILAGALERSPNPLIGYKAYELFFENLETKDVGDETQSHLVLYKALPSFFTNLTTEAGLILELNVLPDEDGSVETSIEDDGSYIKLNYFYRGMDSDDTLSLLAFPYNADRFQLGYSYDIAWGGRLIFPQSSGPVPGIKLNYDRNLAKDRKFYSFIGFKTHRYMNQYINEIAAAYAVLGGYGYDITPTWRFEMNGGYFEQGANPDILDTEVGVSTYGATGRLTWHQGLPISQSVDFKLYRNPPPFAHEPVASESYDNGLSVLVGAEFTYVGQTLGDPEDPGSSKIQPAVAGALNLRVKYRKWRFFGDFYYRDLAYVLLDVPGFVPFEAIADDATIEPEFFLAGGFDYYIEKYRLTPGIIAGVQFPSSYTGDISELYDPALVNTAGRTVVVKDAGFFEILPEGEEAWEIYTIKFNMNWEISEFLDAIGEIYYTYDPNLSKLSRPDPETQYYRVFDDKEIQNQVGFALMLRARF